jgi:hypothetical protein
VLRTFPEETRRAAFGGASILCPLEDCRFDERVCAVRQSRPADEAFISEERRHAREARLSG